jgi:hypothetical protein
MPIGCALTFCFMSRIEAQPGCGQSLAQRPVVTLQGATGHSMAAKTKIDWGVTVRVLQLKRRS